MPSRKSRSSAKKAAANRANALKSTGPQTPAGKEASRRNSLVHGLTAEILLLDHENPAEFQALRDALHADYPPTNALDLEFVDRFVMTLWRMRRIPMYERSIMAWMSHRQHVEHDGPTGEMPVPAKGITGLAPRGLSLAKGPMGEVVLQRLRAGRALEALLERNALGKLDAHQARLSSEFKYLLDWLECQKLARVDFEARRKASGAVDVEPVPASLPRVLPPSVAPGRTSPSAGSEATNVPSTSSNSLAQGSVRGGYVSPTEREARKQEVLAKGANTAD